MKEDYWPTQARIDWADERIKAYLERTTVMDERILENGLPFMIDAIGANLDCAVRDIVKAYCEENGLKYPQEVPDYKARFTLSIDGEKYKWYT